MLVGLGTNKVPALIFFPHKEFSQLWHDLTV